MDTAGHTGDAPCKGIAAARRLLPERMESDDVITYGFKARGGVYNIGGTSEIVAENSRSTTLPTQAHNNKNIAAGASARQ